MPQLVGKKKRANFTVCSYNNMKKSLPYSKTILLIAYRRQIYYILYVRANIFTTIFKKSFSYVLFHAFFVLYV